MLKKEAFEEKLSYINYLYYQKLKTIDEIALDLNEDSRIIKVYYVIVRNRNIKREDISSKHEYS